MENNPSTIGAYFKTLKILSLAIIAGATFFGVILLVLFQTGGLSATVENNKMFLIIQLFATIITIIFSTKSYKGKLTEINDAPTLLDKLNLYRSALIQKLAFNEGGAFLGIVLFMRTGDYTILLLASLNIAMMALSIPSKEKLLNEVSFSDKEISILNSPDEILK